MNYTIEYSAIAIQYACLDIEAKNLDEAKAVKLWDKTHINMQTNYDAGLQDPKIIQITEEDGEDLIDFPITLRS